jgi:hypothetical protein
MTGRFSAINPKSSMSLMGRGGEFVDGGTGRSPCDEDSLAAALLNNW